MGLFGKVLIFFYFLKLSLNCFQIVISEFCFLFNYEKLIHCFFMFLISLICFLDVV